MSRIVLFLVAAVFFCLGCQGDRTALSSDRTFAELRSIKGSLRIITRGAERVPYRRDRLVAGDSVKIPKGGLAWMRRDAGATWLIAGPTTVTLQADTVKIDGGRAFIDTEQGEPVTVATPQGRVELSNARASVEVLQGKVSAYVLRGSARGANGTRANSGELLMLKGKEVEKHPAISWEDWTGGLGTADPTTAPAPFGIGTVGARPPGDQGKPRSALVIERLQVNVTIDQDMAFTEVDQTFVNPTSETVEGIFRFRTPLDAALSGFAVDRDGKLVWGRVKESKSAQQVYESHVYEGSREDPALLSWASPGVYTARLYPIDGGAQRRVVTRYSQWLPRQGPQGKRRLYVYPMAAEGAKSSLPRIEEMTIKIDVSKAQASTIRAGMGGERRGDHIIVKAFDFVPQADLSVELFDEGQEKLVGYRAPHALADAEIPEGKDTAFAREVEKAESDYVAIPLRAPESKRESSGMDLSIVVDTSAATEVSSLAISRSLAGALLAHLGPDDRAALYAGDSDLRAVIAGSDKFSEVTPQLRKKWLAGLSAIERGGATDLGALITKAATTLDPKRNSAVIYIGDGAPSVGEIAPKDLRDRLARLPSGSRIVPVAIGSRPNVALLDQVARGAEMEIVEDAYSAARAALRILESVGRPAWTGARVELGPGIERVLPKKLPPLTANQTVMIVGRRTGKLPTEITIKSAREERRLPIRFNRIEDRGDLRRRWGAIRLATLMDEGAGRSTLVDLSERYALVSPFTSLYVPTRAEAEEEEEPVDDEQPWEKRQAKLRRWKPWSQEAGLSSSALSLGDEEKAAPAEMTASLEENKEGGTGTRAKGEESDQSAKNRRYAVRGPRDARSDSKSMAPAQAKELSKDLDDLSRVNPGALGSGGPSSVPSAESVPEVAEEIEKAPVEYAKKAARAPRPSPAKPVCAPGDPMCGGVVDGRASGKLKGNEIGDAFGGGGLGLAGKGEGGGGIASTGQGFGGGLGAVSGDRLGGSHRSRAPRLRMGKTIVNGKLPTEVIQRIVRQNFGRFRLCYEQGLSRNPQLEGRVAVRFVIGADGAVGSVGNGGSELTDGATVNCIAQAFYGLSFPKPESGVVQVIYPITFSTDRKGRPTIPRSSPGVALPKELRAKTIGWVGHAPVPCGAGADLPFSERRTLWRERLAGRDTVHSLQVYRAALRQCEATNWRERAALLLLMVDQLPSIPARVQLWKALREINPQAAEAVYQYLLLRVRTSADLKELHEALGFETIQEEVLAKRLQGAKSPEERLTRLRGASEEFPEDSELALRVLEAYEDASDEAGGRAWARKLRRRPDATPHLRTSVGEYYLRLAKKLGKKKGARDEREGRRTFGEIVEFAPEDPVARRHLGDLLSAHGWHAEALRQYETLARLTPDDPTVELLLARAAQGTGKTERAVRLAEQAASTSSPDGSQPITIAARALSSLFLADARVEAKAAKRKDELARLRGRAGRLAADTSGAGHRVVMTWNHPELRPVLWTNSLGSMMPSADNLPLLRVAEAHLPVEGEAFVEVRLDPDDAKHAARLGLFARVTVLVREGADDEKILSSTVSFRKENGGEKERVRLKVADDALQEVQP